MPCSPLEVAINVPEGPSGPHIPGFGTPYAFPIPDITLVPNGFPESLLNLLEKFQFLNLLEVLKIEIFSTSRRFKTIIIS